MPDETNGYGTGSDANGTGSDANGTGTISSSTVKLSFGVFYTGGSTLAASFGKFVQ